MGLQITTGPTHPGAQTLSLQGEVDSNSSITLDKEMSRLIAGPTKNLVLEMQAVTFISSAGIGVIMKSQAGLKKKGGDLSMVNLQPQIKRVFEIMQLLPAMNVFENTDELDEYLGKIQQRIIDEGTSISSE